MVDYVYEAYEADESYALHELHESREAYEAYEAWPTVLPDQKNVVRKPVFQGVSSGFPSGMACGMGYLGVSRIFLVVIFDIFDISLGR